MSMDSFCKYELLQHGISDILYHYNMSLHVTKDNIISLIFHDIFVTWNFLQVCTSSSLFISLFNIQQKLVIWSQLWGQHSHPYFSVQIFNMMTYVNVESLHSIFIIIKSFSYRFPYLKWNSFIICQTLIVA